MRESILTEQRAFNKPTSALPWGYQQPPMIPKGGYVGKKDGPVMAFPKREMVLPQGGRPSISNGAMAIQSRDNIRMGILFASKQEITIEDAERLLKLARSGARSALEALLERKLIKFCGRRSNGMQIYVKFDAVVEPVKRSHKKVPAKGTREEFYARQKQAAMDHNRREVERCFGGASEASTTTIAKVLGLKNSSTNPKINLWVRQGLVTQAGMLSKVKLWRKLV